MSKSLSRNPPKGQPSFKRPFEDTGNIHVTLSFSWHASGTFYVTHFVTSILIYFLTLIVAFARANLCDKKKRHVFCHLGWHFLWHVLPHLTTFVRISNLFHRFLMIAIAWNHTHMISHAHFRDAWVFPWLYNLNLILKQNTYLENDTYNIHTMSPHQSHKAVTHFDEQFTSHFFIIRIEVKGEEHLMFDEKTHQFLLK